MRRGPNGSSVLGAAVRDEDACAVLARTLRLGQADGRMPRILVSPDPP